MNPCLEVSNIVDILAPLENILFCFVIDPYENSIIMYVWAT